ncbi:MAG TPA: hypothetical protein GXX40_09480 [Firmicutes bacterium]|nr:hypothetical protein [Bacillota bacterium]
MADSRLWRRSELVDEDVVVAGEFGTNTYAALRAFKCIAGASEPVLPEHVPEICRDIAMGVPRGIRQPSRSE